MIRERARRLLSLTLLAIGGLLLLGAGPSFADGNATWVSSPGQAPAPPAGVQPAPYPVPLGYVGDIEFWAPNRGLLITAGAGVVPAGIYAYNGVAWHQLSTVCGGTDGRIAWAGPDEFWTIADQRPGQITTLSGVALEDVSLCHFLDGQVVASYAMPIDQPDSYEPMNAAACDSASDCWFGGTLDSSGAFHLWWNGSTLTQVDSPIDQETAAMTDDAGQIYESVQLAEVQGQSPLPRSTPLLDVIDSGDGADPFGSLFPTATGCVGFCPILPQYTSTTGTGSVDPATLGGLALSSDSQAGAIDPALWAAAGTDGATPEAGDNSAAPVVLFMQDGNWTQVVPDLVTFPNGDTPVQGGVATPAAESIAAEPNDDAAWIAVNPATGADGQGHVDRIALTGSSSAMVTDTDTLGDPQGVGPRGSISAITCPAAEDCWAATSEGWLFHLTDGTQFAQDTDSNFSGVITYRPPDSGVPVVTLTNASPDTIQTPAAVVTHFGNPTTITRHRKVRPVITHVGKALLHGTTLKLPITVRVRARVQLIARRGKAVVARSAAVVLKPGHRFISVVLNRKRWPTAMSLSAKPVKPA